MGTRARRAASLSATWLLAALAFVSSVRAQAPPPTGPDLLPAQQVEVVRVEVVVTEKRGRPRTGLRREDFAVFEDGKPQAIVQFLAFARPQPSPSSATASPVAPEEGAEAGASTRSALPGSSVEVLVMSPSGLAVASNDFENMRSKFLPEEEPWTGESH